MDGTRSERKIAETRLHERNCSTHNQKTTQSQDTTADTDAISVNLQIEKQKEANFDVKLRHGTLYRCSNRWKKKAS
jgi:hypothetical protein